MTPNPIATIRLISNLAIVAVTAAFVLLTLAAQVGASGKTGVWIISGVAITAALLQSAAHLMFPQTIEPAWDEEVQHSNRASYLFGYWAVMATFLTLLAGTWAGVVDPAMAFYLLAPVLGAAPCGWMAVAALLGRAA